MTDDENASRRRVAILGGASSLLIGAAIELAAFYGLYPYRWFGVLFAIGVPLFSTFGGDIRLQIMRPAEVAGRDTVSEGGGIYWWAVQQAADFWRHNSRRILHYGPLVVVAASVALDPGPAVAVLEAFASLVRDVIEAVQAGGES